MKPLHVAIFATICLLSFSCQEDNATPARRFRIGFTPFPYDVSLPALQETYSNITTIGDIINHHFDNGVPWMESLSGDPFHKNIENDWNFRKSVTPPNCEVIVSVTALNMHRNGIAKYRGESDDMDLPSPWDTYSFNHENIRTAYVNYCKRVIDFFRPNYFNMNVEANLLHFENPSLWRDFIAFHHHVYQQLKTAYPSLVIFSSVAGAHLLEGYFPGNDVSLQRLAALQVLESSDLYGISFYPHLSRFGGNPYPKNSFKELFALSDKPKAIAETGYPAQDFTIATGRQMAMVRSDVGKQRQFVKDLFDACSKEDLQFVIYFCVRDYDQLWQHLGGEHDLTIAWRDTGIIDEFGNKRPSFDVWQNFYLRQLK